MDEVAYFKQGPFNFACRHIRSCFRDVTMIHDFLLHINMKMFVGFQGRLPVRWMAIESLNYSVYTTKSDVYVHSSAPTQTTEFNC